MYCDPDDNGYLPQHLWLNGIATLIHNNAKACVWDIATMLADNKQPYCHVQGFTPPAFRLDQGHDQVDNNCDRGGHRELDRWGSPGFRDRGLQDRDRGAHLVVVGVMPLVAILSGPISAAGPTCPT